MKLAIIGSRSATKINIRENITSHPSSIISGGAKGVDRLAALFAKENNIELIEYLPDYIKYGRGATFIRNRHIIDNADMVLVFWDGKSKGTKYSIDYARMKNKQIKIVLI